MRVTAVGALLGLTLLWSCTNKRAATVRDTSAPRGVADGAVDGGAGDGDGAETPDASDSGAGASDDSGQDSGTSPTSAACVAWSSPIAAGEVADASLEEISGLVVSSINPGVLWVLEDSGGEPVLTALDLDGGRLGALTLSGVVNRDWEDLAAGPCGADSCLFVGEFGDNNEVRTDAAILRVVEPVVTGMAGFELTAEPLVVPISYAEGPQNAEALVVEADGVPVVLTKRADGTANMYRIESMDGTPYTAALGGQVVLGGGSGLGSMATSADLWPDGTQMVIRTYTGAWVYSLADAGVLGAVERTPTAVNTGLEMQGEAIAYDPADGALWHVSEGVRPTLYRLPCADR